MPRVLLILLLATAAQAQDWPQWGRTPQHDGATTAAANRLDRIEARIVIDPLIDDEKAFDDGEVLIHYPVPLIDGDDLYLLEKGGAFTTHELARTQVWNVKNVRRTSAGYVTRWIFKSDWFPVPTADPDGGLQWEPVFHPVLGADVVWVPGAGGTMFKVRRADGVALGRVNPFGTTIDDS